MVLGSLAIGRLPTVWEYSSSCANPMPNEAMQLTAGRQFNDDSMTTDHPPTSKHYGVAGRLGTTVADPSLPSSVAATLRGCAVYASAAQLSVLICRSAPHPTGFVHVTAWQSVPFSPAVADPSNSCLTDRFGHCSLTVS